MIGTIARLDLRDALLSAYGIAIGRRRDIAVPQGIPNRTTLILEIRDLLFQSTKLRFVNRE